MKSTYLVKMYSKWSTTLLHYVFIYVTLDQIVSSEGSEVEDSAPSANEGDALPIKKRKGKITCSR